MTLTEYVIQQPVQSQSELYHVSQLTVLISQVMVELAAVTRKEAVWPVYLKNLYRQHYAALLEAVVRVVTA